MVIDGVLDTQNLADEPMTVTASSNRSRAERRSWHLRDRSRSCRRSDLSGEPTVRSGGISRVASLTGDRFPSTLSVNGQRPAGTNSRRASAPTTVMEPRNEAPKSEFKARLVIMKSARCDLPDLRRGGNRGC